MSAPEDFLYRETALCRFPDPEERETLQRFGSLVLAWAVGAEHSVGGKATQTASSLAAVAADLRHLSVYLRGVVDEVEGNVVEPAEAHLGFLAKRWVPRVAALAREVESAVEAAEADAQPETEPDRTARLWTALREAQRLAAFFEELAEAGGGNAHIYREQHRRASDLGTDLLRLLDDETGQDAGSDEIGDDSGGEA
ncbi:MAG TPA: hypothetical protein VLF66_04350 [Thermoanaerobaculia bacterium]|nr:hypothetical protein [Thermoanaerobaculia bacterium]